MDHAVKNPYSSIVKTLAPLVFDELPSDLAQILSTLTHRSLPKPVQKFYEPRLRVRPPECTSILKHG